MVKGDIFLELSTKFADQLAIPLTVIFNEGYRRGQWPQLWKEETAVIIPKCRQPEGRSDLELHAAL